MSYESFETILNNYINSLPTDDYNKILKARYIANGLYYIAGYDDLCISTDPDLTFWRGRNSKDIDNWIPGHIAIVKSPVALACAWHMNKITFDPLYQLPDFPAETLIISSDFLETSPDGARKVEELSEIVPVLYDQRKDARGVSLVSRDNYFYAKYKGEVPEKVFLTGMKIVFRDVIRSIWNSNVITRKHGKHSDANIRSITRAKNLADALFVGENEIFLPTGAGTGDKDLLPSLIHKMFYSKDIIATNMTNKMTKTYDSVYKLKDICEIWKYAAEQYSLSIRLEEEDLNNTEKLNQQIKKLGDAIDVSCFLDSYFQGVPLEDIII